MNTNKQIPNSKFLHCEVVGKEIKLLKLFHSLTYQPASRGKGSAACPLMCPHEI